MDEQAYGQKKSKKVKNPEAIKRWKIVAITVCITIGILFLVLTGVYYWQKGEARKALRQGKNIYLAAMVTAVECDGEGKKFIDINRESGVSKAAEDSICELTQTEGDFTIFQWDTDKAKERSLVYIEGNYLVYLTYHSPEDMEWNVYRLDHLLKHE